MNGVKNEGQETPWWLRDPSQLGPIDPTEFAEVLEQAQEVAEGERPAPDLAKIRAESIAAGGRHVEIRDCPAHRVAAWMAERYRDDPEKGYNIVHRVVALTGVLGAPGMEKWVRTHGGTYLVHPAVVAAGATCRLTSDGAFDPDEFVGEVERIARERFPDVAPPGLR